MRRIFLLISMSFVVAGVLLLSGCADLRNQAPGAGAPTSPSVTVHAPNWNNPADSVAFHGAYLRGQNWDPSSCRSCHGGMYTGGTSGVDCFRCHASAPHQGAFAQPGGHVGFVMSHGFGIADCQVCHGSNYSGNTYGVPTCSSAHCHATAGGVPKSPEACNTCHGTFRADAGDTVSWAPPRAINGDTSESSQGVGAHLTHLQGGGDVSSLDVPCATCHNVPNNVTDPGHINPGSGPVIVLSGMASKRTGGVTPASSYSAAANQCSNVYCHGAWKLYKATSRFSYAYTDSVMLGASYAPKWNGGGNEVACGTCHGLPPKGHAIFAGPCSICHRDDFDASGNLVKEKHINGKIDVNAFEYDFP